MDNKIIEFLVESGAELTGSSVGALIGWTITGSGRVVAGVVGRKAIEMVFSKLWSEIQSKVLSERENKK